MAEVLGGNPAHMGFGGLDPLSALAPVPALVTLLFASAV